MSKAKRPKDPEFVAKVEGQDAPADVPEFVAGDEEQPAASVEDVGDGQDHEEGPANVEDLDQPLPELPAAPPAKPWYRVSLEDSGPTSHHQANTETEAWEHYKRRHGIISSSRIATITKLVHAETIARVEAEEAARLKARAA